MLSGRIKTGSSHIDLYIFLIGIYSLEISIDHCFIPFRILNRIPGIYAEFMIPGKSVYFRLHHFVQRGYFIHGFSIQINFAGMGNKGSDKPVSTYQCCIGIIIPEIPVRNPRHPHISFIILPVFHRFCTCDHRFPFFLGAVNNSGLSGAGILWIHPLTINSWCHDHLVPRSGKLCGFPDRL